MNKNRITKRAYLQLLIPLIIILLLLPQTLAVSNLTIQGNTTTARTDVAATAISTLGGTFTTLTLNVTAQTRQWKAYVGNVSGLITLDDATNTTIYDWSLSTISGEVYAARTNSIDWSDIQCANVTNVDDEQTALNIPTNASDSINRTFNTTTHKAFYVATTSITNSDCPATATYVNDAAQAVSEDALFQEIILQSGDDFVYTTLLEPGTAGFDLLPYNFQMIVAEDATTSDPTPYYFYVELT